MPEQDQAKNLNLEFYTGQDAYSDGAIEEDLLQIVQNHVNVHEVLTKDHRWPILYHLSPQRRNLLEWYPFKPTASLLEIGAGCGALTGLFCEKVKHVTAIELSKRRATIIQERCHTENLEIVVGNFQDMTFKKRFDYVTLIGVLEYTKRFFTSRQPYHDLFAKIQTWLKPQGTLVIALENKLGLKYFAGAPEDHTGAIFKGIEGYPGVDGIETFGKHEITELLQQHRFTNLKFYYPYPDYKLPIELYSDEYLPTPATVLFEAPNYDTDRYQLFREQLAFGQIIRNRQFDLFANSYLIFAKQGGPQQ
ncbi:class I SAM-dependent methyltransferase [candidate division KSB1 bacterium]|nr:class I SAM-dependent methyltransferase [candidate division KSB1 bacterium]